MIALSQLLICRFPIIAVVFLISLINGRMFSFVMPVAKPERSFKIFFTTLVLNYRHYFAPLAEQLVSGPDIAAITWALYFYKVNT